MQIESGKIYRHFRGDYYVVVGEAGHTETGERMIIYHPLRSPDILFARPKEMFFEKVPQHCYPEDQELRFVPVEREEI